MALSDPSNTIIRRMRLSVAMDGLTVTVGAGVCYLPNTRRLISDGTSSVTLVSPTPSTWYYAYAYEASPGVVGLEMSTTAPSAPYPTASSTARTKIGDITRRYLGSVYVQASGLIRPFRHVNAGDLGNLILFSAATVGGGVPVTLLSAFVASTATILSLSPIIPPTATHARIDVKNASNRTVYLSNPDAGAASPTNWIISAQPNESVIGDIELSAAQQLSAILSTTGLLGAILGTILSGQVNLYVQGYHFDR